MRKISIVFDSLPQNSEKSANNRFRAKPVKYTNFYDIFAIVWPILIKYRTVKHIRLPNLISNQKFENFKIQLDWRRSVENWTKNSISFYLYPKTANKAQITVFIPNAWNIQTFTISLLLCDQFWWNFAQQSIFAFPS